MESSHSGMGLTGTDEAGIVMEVTGAPDEIAEVSASPMRIKRKRLNLTQEQLADRVKRDQTTISDVELGRARPSLELAAAIARELGSTVDELFVAS